MAKEKSISSTEHHARHAQKGNRQSFALLYDRVAPALYAWAAIRISPRHQGRLEPSDIVQDTWWRTLDAFDQFDPAKGSFRAWMFRIATNVLTDHYRRMNVRGQLATTHKTGQQQSLPDDVLAQLTSISQAAARNDDAAHIIAAVSALEKDDQDLVTYCGLEGLTTVEAAPVLGITPKACEKRWQRLRSRLRESPKWQSFLSITTDD
ncbi:MAG: RNA polymerase sigma factor (sigma-70 family) [Planctomycetota bacterium]|jgi:RNA polymerase sigma factor (sigma-70 family)